MAGADGEPKNTGQFRAGNPGRPKGVPNKLSRTVKAEVERVFAAIQEVPGARLEDWAIQNTTEFYKISAKLIPAELDANVTGSLVGILSGLGRTAGETDDPPVA